MSDMPIITTKYSILDILKRPENFVDEYSNTEILTLPDRVAAGGILRISVGADPDEGYHLIVEDDDFADDIYPNNEENLLEAFVRILNDNIERAPD